MKIAKILSASNVNELKVLGSYLEIRRCLEVEIDNKLGVNGWESLFAKVQKIKKSASSKKDLLSAAFANKSFKEAKGEISRILQVKITAKNRDNLEKKVRQIISVFCVGIFNPYEHYEKTKLMKFKSSSRLEGIDIEIPSENESIESVLAKYRR